MSAILDDQLFTIPEAGKILKRGNTSIYSMINSRELEAVKLGKNTRITGRAIKSLIASLPRYESEV